MDARQRIREHLVAALQELDAADVREGRGGGTKVPPPLPSPRGRGPLSPTNATESEDDDVVRPALYVHKPQRRFDELDKIRTEKAHFLDVLKMQSFEGFYNLSFVLLAFSLSYIVIKNVYTHGPLLSASDFLCAPLLRDIQDATVLVAFCYAWTFAVYGIVKAYLANLLSVSYFVGFYIFVQAVLLLVPVVAMYNLPMAPIPSMGVIATTIILMMKSHSFVATNFLLLTQGTEASDSDSGEPTPADNDAADNTKRTNSGRRRIGKVTTPSASTTTTVTQPKSIVTITLLHFAYFLCVPCLVYEPKYPRLHIIRWMYIWGKAGKMLLCFGVQYALMAQFMLPVLRKTTTAQWSSVWFDILKLALPSFLTWLLGFYMMFHCACNILAELCQYADRQFYKDFWNATTLDAFWRLWNVPVHEWCHRHIYTESMHYAKVSKMRATFTVFLISAALHELLFSVAFKTFRPWFFAGMLIQIPMIAMSQHFKGTRRGNILVWMSLFCGQPLLEILYFREWFSQNASFFCVE